MTVNLSREDTWVWILVVNPHSRLASRFHALSCLSLAPAVSYALKEFEISSTLALDVCPPTRSHVLSQTLMRSQRVWTHCQLSALTFAFPPEASCLVLLLTSMYSHWVWTLLLDLVASKFYTCVLSPTLSSLSKSLNSRHWTFFLVWPPTLIDMYPHRHSCVLKEFELIVNSRFSVGLYLAITKHIQITSTCKAIILQSRNDRKRPRPDRKRPRRREKTAFCPEDADWG